MAHPPNLVLGAIWAPILSKKDYKTSPKHTQIAAIDSCYSLSPKIGGSEHRVHPLSWDGRQQSLLSFHSWPHKAGKSAFIGAEAGLPIPSWMNALHTGFLFPPQNHSTLQISVPFGQDTELN